MEFEFESAKELIKSFDRDVIKQKIEEIKQQITNIELDRPQYEGIKDHYIGRIIPDSEKKSKIKYLKSKIEDLKEESKRLADLNRELSKAIEDMEEIAKRSVLLNEFEELFILRRQNYDKFQKTDIFEKNEKGYLKLYTKSRDDGGLFTNSQHAKINREMYQLLKKNKNLTVKKTYTVYHSIGSVFEQAKTTKNKKLNMENIFNQIYSETKQKYIHNLPALGVDVQRLEMAANEMQGEPNRASMTFNGREAFDRLQALEVAIKNKYNVKGNLFKLKEDYKEIVELSREIWYIEEFLKSFENTIIKDSELYRGLIEINKDQEEELRKLIHSADKEYEKTGLQNKIDLIEQLEELYRKIEELNLKIEQYKNMGREDQADYCQQEYYNVRYEMIKILKDNPDLNKPKYNIDIKKIIEEERKMFEPEIKKGLNKPEQPIVEENKDYRISSEIPSYIKTPEEEIFVEKTVPQTSVTEQKVVENVTNTEEIPSYIKTPEEEMFVEKAYIEESGKLERFELDSSLQIFRTMHYQDYMREKVLNSDLGKLSFSAYLESVAPHLTKLIEIEKERETLARTIYRDYIRYYSSLENKKDAIEFYEFAGNNYGISNVDVPIEHEEEYKGMIKR